MKKTMLIMIMVLGLIFSFQQYSLATPILSQFDSSWNMFANDDGELSPGGGGQFFDAEYLLYKYDATSKVLSLGLQAGFDIEDGEQGQDGLGSYDYDALITNYWAGDLALSFDGDAGGLDTYEYAVKFNFGTTHTNGIGGLYNNGTWDYRYPTNANPFVLNGGSLVADDSALGGSIGGFTTISSGRVTVGGETSFFQMVSIDLSATSLLTEYEANSFNASWTMSCGNDIIEGSPVPEPQTIMLMTLGCFMLVFSNRKRLSRKNK